MSINSTDLDALLDRIATYRFRSQFHLRRSEESFVALRGMDTVRSHATDLLTRRLAPAQPKNDGKQTPWGGHPVFRAQHATGTCCRGCLSRLHGIPAGRALSDDELGYVVDVICRWVEREVGHRRPAQVTDTLTDHPE